MSVAVGAAGVLVGAEGDDEVAVLADGSAGPVCAAIVEVSACRGTRMNISGLKRF